MYKEGQDFLQSWCNDTKNEGYEKELKEYGEKEVEDMLYEYRLKFSLSGVVKSLKDKGLLTLEDFLKANNCEQQEHGTWTHNGVYMYTQEFISMLEKYYNF